MTELKLGYVISWCDKVEPNLHKTNVSGMCLL